MKKTYKKAQIFGKNFNTGQVFSNAPQLESILDLYLVQEAKQEASEKVHESTERMAMCGGKMRVSDEMIHREIAGEHLLIPTGSLAIKIHGMISVTESGILLFEKLQEECEREELIEAILAEYDIDRETAAADVDAFLAKLNAIGVLLK